MGSRRSSGWESKSLWNGTLSPGWKREDVEILRLALMKLGVGKWKEIIESGCLPGKTRSQLSLQCQRLLGQQSIGVYQRNQKKKGTRKNGCLVNVGNTQTHEERIELLEENMKRFSLTPEEIEAIVLPDKTAEKKNIQKNQEYLFVLKERLHHLRSELLGRRETDTKEETKKETDDSNQVDMDDQDVDPVPVTELQEMETPPVELVEKDIELSEPLLTKHSIDRSSLLHILNEPPKKKVKRENTPQLSFDFLLNHKPKQ